jgi:GyrI-like small molecule binding domain
MFLRLALAAALAAAIFAAAEQQPAWAESPAPSPPAAPAKPDAAQPAPAAPSQAAPAQAGDPFGEDATLTAKPIVYLKGTGTWDNAVHRGSYDGLDNTYEAITNYLDDHKLEAKDMFIEQYLTDPLTANEDHLVVNVYVLIK